MSLYDVIIGSDHAGFDVKHAINMHLADLGRTPLDIGPESKESCDYPIKAAELCKMVLQTGFPGILICGSGLGMSMSANRFHGIRAALCTNEYLARMARAHNNANVLCLGSRVLGEELAKSIVSVFLTTDFEGQRHQRRIDQIEALGRPEA
jgi:ribose 5-phosphate isomerase B